MTTEADLIAAIQADPDDEAGYLVYGDLLQQRGDPRGELIALQRARNDDAVARYVAKHRAALLGRLAEYDARTLEVQWYLGFVRRVSVDTARDDEACALLRVLADEPCCRFLRLLDVVIHDARQGYARVDATLVELARPVTLQRIHIGLPGQHSNSKALRDAFPALGIGEMWPRAVAAVGKLKMPATSLDPGDLPVLAMRDGKPLPLDAASLIGALSVEVGREKPIGVVAALAATCAGTDRDRYAEALLAAWQRAGGRPQDAWVIDAAQVLGARRAAWAIGRRIGDLSHQRAEQAVVALVRMNHSHAVLELFAVSRGHMVRAVHAERGLELQAATTGKSLAALVARAGAAPLTNVDHDAAARAIALDDIVVEWLMTTGWTARVRAVVPWFVTSSRAARTERLVWARHRDGALEPFRWSEGHAVDVAGAQLELVPEDVVSILHPAQLAERDRERWRAVMREPPGFPQLDRELLLASHRPTEADVEALVVAAGLAGIDVLRERGFREALGDYEARSLAGLAKRYRWANVDYTVAIGLADRRIYPSQPGLPAVVLQELARDLVPRGRLGAS